MSEPARIDGQLVVYCRPWCGSCAMALHWLDEHGIGYEMRDVDQDADARAFAESCNQGRLHTPTFTFGDATCVDFDPRRLEDILGLR